MSNLPFPLSERYYHYSRYLRRHFGEKVYRISLDAGCSCPTRDGKLGTGGCLYCNNSSFVPQRAANLPPVRTQLLEGIENTRKRQKTAKFFAYFQAYTNTYKPITELEQLYRSVLDIPGVVGIIIATRPDCVDADILNLLADIGQNTYVSIEYGIESVYDKTLEWVRRGHTFTVTRRAFEQTKKAGIHTGGHIIFGFPTESRQEILLSAAVLNALQPDALKIHHLHVVKNSGLAELYRQKPFALFTESEWIILISDFLERLAPEIVIQRLVGDAQPGTLIAPQWQMPKIRILQGIQAELTRRGTYQGARVIARH